MTIFDYVFLCSLFVVAHMGVGICFGSLFCGVGLSVLSSLAIILLSKRGLAVLLYYVVAVCVLCLFLALPCVGLRSVSMAFSDHTFGLQYH